MRTQGVFFCLEWRKLATYISSSTWYSLGFVLRISDKPHDNSLSRNRTIFTTFLMELIHVIDR